MTRALIAAVILLSVAVVVMAQERPGPVTLSVDKMVVDVCPVRPWRRGRVV